MAVTTGVGAAAERYLALAVEASAGPAEIVEVVLGDPPSPEAPRAYGELAAEADALAGDVAAEASERAASLAAHLRALAAACRVAAGGRPPLERLVPDLLGGVRATRVDEARFDEALAELDALVPGTGDLRGRVEAWRRRRALPVDRLAPLARRLLDEARRRTAASVSLPDGDAVEVAVVRGRPWSASSTYLGGLRSRIELGADEPPTFARLVDLVCHEAYPGHHAERVRLELRGRPECRPVLAVGPSSVRSEGLASLAPRLVFDEDDVRSLSPAGAEEEVVEWRAAAILSRLRAVNSNAALLPPGERAGYLVRYGLRSPDRAQRIAAWLGDPLHAAYAFAYPAGLSLVEALVARNGRAETLRLLLS
jgi:hypothetical protein